MSGEWSGGVANRTWQRKGHRGGPVDGDTERGQRLYAERAHTPFWCETCGGCHALGEHKACRAKAVHAILQTARGRTP